MSLLRRTRTEMAGAWRSLRYDLGRGTPAEPPADGPDVTSTGMGTFGLEGLGGQIEPAQPVRRPRRAVAVTAFGTLTVAGAAGAYLAVVNGLGSLVSGSEAEAGTLPPRPAATTAVGLGPSSPAGPTTKATRIARPVTPEETAALTPIEPPPAVAVPPVRSPGRTATTRPPSPECHCGPPVPTPTAPSPTPTPTPSPSPSDSPSPSPSPSESGDADHSADPSPSRSWHRNGHRRHR
ncbi:hypothetical protein [Actinoplanes solisilvae]|uniref:hypothetical protein n=1 Tax=Actinoplanes solisilvae TaxID=2486853 RepID=UPI000FDB82A1|nr:hypothetical protein [Actinoplanes solisilvae]